MAKQHGKDLGPYTNPGTSSFRRGMRAPNMRRKHRTSKRS